jgi:hypothetical protein
MAKRIRDGDDRYDPVSQKFLTELGNPTPKAPVTETKPEGPAAISPLKQRSREKRVLVDAEEDVLIEAQVQRLAAELGTPIKLSHVLRGFLGMFRRAEPHIMAQARHLGPMTRPPNGDLAALTRFEEEIGELLAAGFRETPRRR